MPQPVLENSVSTRALAAVALAAALLTPWLVLAEDRAKGSGKEFLLVFVGGSAGDGATPTLDRLKHRLESVDPERALVVFTGNYGVGEFPAEEEEGRARAERDALAHVAATADFVKRGGRVYFLAGQRDFAEGGTKPVRRLRKFLNRSFEAAIGATDSDDKLDVMPHASCGDPIELKLTDTLALVLLNSQWWMQDWANDPEANQDCEVKTRSVMPELVRGLFSGHRNRRLIIATHHPLASYGELGGAFTAAAHLTPAPIIGTLGVLARQAGLVPQYQNHPMVRSYLEMLYGEAQRHGGFVFVSGHDGNLQALKRDKQTQLISGTSARGAEPTTATAEGDFAAAAPGWAELTIEPSGAGEAALFSGTGEHAALFRQQLPEPTSFEVAAPPPPVPPGPVAATYSQHRVWKTGAVAKFLVGSFYSDAYALELPYQPLDLGVEQGGLEPFKTGGGLQTNTLRLHDPAGGDWAIRSTTKDSSRALPYPFNQLRFVNRLIDHGFTATHPEAALAIPRLARALGVLHPEPRLFYLADQAGLGTYRGYLGDGLVQLEQRAKAPKKGVLPEAQAGAPSAEGATRFRSTAETLEKLLEKPGMHRVDQEAMLRARLLDLFVGDWDRHQGQWTFAATRAADGSRTYTPIPQDRDQAFANYDGLGLALARIGAPLSRNLQPFSSDYGSVSWLLYSARDLDPVLLNRLGRERWMAIAAEVQAALTDQVIDEAFLSWHPEAYQLDGARIAAHLKARRERLVEVAAEFFEHLNRNVDILGSTKDDTFELWFEERGRLRVSVRAQRDGAPAYFARVFEPDQTGELRLYALAGDDALIVHGTPHGEIDVRFVGGPGKDTVSAANRAGATLEARAIRLYDTEEGATIDRSITVRDERSNLPHFNQYDRAENHDPDYGSFIPGLLINADDGVYLGGQLTYLVHGYKKSPFAARHQLEAHFATATLGAVVDYRGLFPQSAAQLDQQLELALASPTYTRNFFGYTNQLGGEDEAPDFHRVRQARVEGRYGVSFGFNGDRSRVGAQLLGQAIVTEATPGRFVSLSPDVGPEALGPRYFAGARLFAQTNTYDNLAFPRRGVALQAALEGRYDLVRGGQFSTSYRATAATAIPFDRQQRFVLLTRAKVEGIVGEHPFYFAPTLGTEALRAYSKQQFAGDVVFAHSTDLRVDVFRIYSGLPGTIGVNVSVDHGRAFGAGITGDDYHLSLGGGVWWFLLDTFGISLSYHRSIDGASRFSLAVGPLFADTGW